MVESMGFDSSTCPAFFDEVKRNDSKTQMPRVSYVSSASLCDFISTRRLRFFCVETAFLGRVEGYVGSILASDGSNQACPIWDGVHPPSRQVSSLSQNRLPYIGLC